jgi:D-3-phosphoglycerate dehydrogenase
MGVTKVELDELLKRADFITLHVPLTDKTRNILSPRPGQDQEGRAHHQLRARRPGRRGGAGRALKSGHVAGAGFDVFETEPATETRCSTCPTSSAPRIWAPRPPRRRKTWRCRWPSRCRTTC